MGTCKICKREDVEVQYITISLRVGKKDVEIKVPSCMDCNFIFWKDAGSLEPGKSQLTLSNISTIAKKMYEEKPR